MFEKAVRNKFRFKLPNGLLSVEDLWDLSLEDLDKLAKALNKEVKELEEESFIKKRTAANRLVEDKFEIVKHIITVKLNEIEERKVRAAKKERADLIKDLIEKKKISSLEGKSLEDLEKELADLKEA